MQVKYEGPVSEFGWLIPVPARPTVAPVPMACFYELSKFVQIRMQPHYGVPRLSLGLGGDGSAEPKVKVLEEKTLGALDDSPRNRQRQKLPKEYFRLLS